MCAPRTGKSSGPRGSPLCSPRPAPRDSPPRGLAVPRPGLRIPRPGPAHRFSSRKRSEGSEPAPAFLSRSSTKHNEAVISAARTPLGPVRQHCHRESAPHAPSPRRSRTITNYRRAQRAAGNQRLCRPRLQDMRSAAQDPVRRQWIRADARQPAPRGSKGREGTKARRERTESVETSWIPFLRALCAPALRDRDSLAQALALPNPVRCREPGRWGLADGAPHFSRGFFRNVRNYSCRAWSSGRLAAAAGN